MGKIDDEILYLGLAFVAASIGVYFINRCHKLELWTRVTLPLVVEGMERRGAEIPNCLRACADQYELYADNQGFYDALREEMARIKRAEQILGVRCGG